MGLSGRDGEGFDEIVFVHAAKMNAIGALRGDDRQVALRGMNSERVVF